MADITNVFKATVKTMRVREKSLGGVTGVDKNILPTCRKPKTEFTANAMEVVSIYLPLPLPSPFSCCCCFFLYGSC